MVTVPHKMVGLERMSDYGEFHCIKNTVYVSKSTVEPSISISANTHTAQISSLGSPTTAITAFTQPH